MDSLRLEGLAQPHYMAYRVEDGVELNVEVRTRRLDADVRAGSPQLDNTNFAGPGAAALGWVEIGFDDNYGAIRRFAWRITDSRFKAAAERLARKQAALESRPPLDAPSFVAEPARNTIEPAVALAVDEATWSDSARRRRMHDGRPDCSGRPSALLRPSVQLTLTTFSAAGPF